MQFNNHEDKQDTVLQTAALLIHSGRAAGLDGRLTLVLTNSLLAEGCYYLLIRHRNHLPMMSRSPGRVGRFEDYIFDFTTDEMQAEFVTAAESPMVSSGRIWSIAAGDIDTRPGGDSKINSPESALARNNGAASG